MCGNFVVSPVDLSTCVDHATQVCQGDMCDQSEAHWALAMWLAQLRFPYLGSGTWAKAAALRQRSSVGAVLDDGNSHWLKLVWSLYIDTNPIAPPAGSPENK